jgi:hypothetical protein
MEPPKAMVMEQLQTLVYVHRLLGEKPRQSSDWIAALNEVYALMIAVLADSSSHE